MPSIRRARKHGQASGFWTLRWPVLTLAWRKASSVCREKCEGFVAVQGGNVQRWEHSVLLCTSSVTSDIWTVFCTSEINMWGTVALLFLLLLTQSPCRFLFVLLDQHNVHCGLYKWLQFAWKVAEFSIFTSPHPHLHPHSHTVADIGSVLLTYNDALTKTHICK
jgi:hypothetical protein